ncbi:MAG: hypothetical protein ACRDZO_01155 [Egibacteraceae bacterium]
MTPPLASRQPDNPIHRISRRPDAWAWPDWAYAGEDGTFGNRYDDPHGEYRALYASSRRLGAFLETLARYRPDPAVIAADAEIAGDEPDEAFPTIAPGLVPAEWLERRCIRTASYDGRCADVGHSDALAHLRVALADRVLHHRLGDLDGAEFAVARTASVHAGDLALRLGDRARTRRGARVRDQLPLAAGRRARELGDLRAQPAHRRDQPAARAR